MFRTIALFLILSFTATFAHGRTVSGGDEVPVVPKLGEHRYALVVGIGDYADGQIPDLTLSESDARAIYDLLTDVRFGGVNADNATLLIGPDATAANFRKALSDLSRVPAEATVLIYFSGRGVKQGDDAFLMMRNAELSDVVGTAVSGSDVRALVDAIPARHVMVMFDLFCTVPTAKGEQVAISNLSGAIQQFVSNGPAFLVGIGSGREVIEVEEGEQSIFTHYLLEGLTCQADLNVDGVIVLRELAGFLYYCLVSEARVRDGFGLPILSWEHVREAQQFRLSLNGGLIDSWVKDAACMRRLAKIESMYAKKELTREQAILGTRLMRDDPEGLSSEDSELHKVYLQVLAGELSPEKLPHPVGQIRITGKHKAPLKHTLTRQTELQQPQKISEKVNVVELIGNKIVYVEIDIGAEDGVKPKMKFWCHRGGRFLGTLVAEEVGTSATTCRAIFTEEPIRKGDKVLISGKR